MPSRRTHRRREAGRERPEGARPLWSGTLSFGLVSIPVDLYPATRGGGAALRMLAPDGTPLARRFYCPKDGEAVPYEHLERGYEHAPGQYVVVTDAELEALAPEKSRDIDLRFFVPRAALDPVHFERAFHLWPSGSSAKAYHLLAGVLQHGECAGIGTFVMREHEYLVAILARDGMLRAQTLRFADEVRSSDALDLPRSARVPDADVARFAKRIRAHARAGVDLAALRDPHADALRKLARQKSRSSSRVVHAPAQDAAPGDVESVDLMAVLQRSLGARKAAPRRRSSGARRSR